MSTLTVPQLVSGAIAQFPVRKHVSRRTIVNRTAGDHLVKMADPEGAQVAWDLPYSALTDDEMAVFVALFEACEGRLRPFVFVDPMGNLLKWTENLSESVWQTGLLVASGIEDADGGSGANRLTNGAQAPQSISQTLDAPGTYTYTYTFSV